MSRKSYPMTVSPNRIRRLAAAVAGRTGAAMIALITVMAIAGTGHGQTTRPISPQPLAPPAPKSLAPTTAPKPQTGSEGAGQSEPRTGLLPVKIDVEALRATDRDSVGTLGDEQGGFGLDMWAGTRRALVEKLLLTVPAQSSSRMMRNLLRRLLLSVAKAPPPDAADGSAEKAAGAATAAKIGQQQEPERKQKKGLIHLRVERLSAMGDIAAVDQLLKVAPSRENDQILLRSEADVLFYGNDYARVCPLVASQIRQVSTAYWRKAFIFCQALAGEHDRSARGVTLLQEQGVEDPVF